MQEKKIVIASDHAAVEAKEQIIKHLQDQGYDVVNYGTNDANSPVDYPDKAYMVAKGITKNEAPMGILLCGSGIGMSIAINRYPNMRGALCNTVEMARLARAHNNANVLVLGGRLTPIEILLDRVDTFLTTPFDGGRHETRIKKLERMPDEL